MATVNRAERFWSVPRFGRFSVYEVTGPCWKSWPGIHRQCLTYVPTATGFLYLAVVLET